MRMRIRRPEVPRSTGSRARIAPKSIPRTVLISSAISFLAVFYCPAVEIVGFLVVVIENLSEYNAVGGVAECFGSRQNPLAGVFFLGKVGIVVGSGAVAAHFEVVVVDRLPAVLKFFKHASAAFGEACVAEPPSLFVSTSPRVASTAWSTVGRSLSGYALVALAVVVGADVELEVVFAVVPYDAFGVCFHFGRSCCLGAAFVELGKKPASGNDGVRLEKFERSAWRSFQTK